MGAALLGSAPVPLPGQRPTGTIEGHVRDGDSKPIANATVFIVGSTFSATTNASGYYAIFHVPVGTMVLRAVYPGYKAFEATGIRVTFGGTVTQEFVLQRSPQTVAEIEVKGAAKTALVPRDQVSSRQIIDGDYVDKLPVDRLSAAFAFQPGVTTSTCNSSASSCAPALRGGRTDEQATYLNGVPVGATSRSLFSPKQLGIATNAFEDASITTGATSSEFGGGRGGVRCGFSQGCEGNTESYDRIIDNPFLASSINPLSTFSIDVDRASYSNVRRFITMGERPRKDAVRIEELINYFPYQLPAPDAESRQPFTVTTEVAAAPWNSAHRLVRIGLQGRKVDIDKLPPTNLVFLVDVSGSMDEPNKLPLVKSSLRMLVEQMREQDRVALAVYAGNAGLVLPSTSGVYKDRILDAIDRLSAGGSTAGGAGLRLAYRVARENFISGGNNRVILSTDGDFNVGLSSDAEMETLIEEERNHGVSLTVLGFGMGNYKDSKMEKLADKGNGNYAYIDGLVEARKTLVHEMGGTLLTIAKDVKLQVEFNPARVQGYRLIGYENRMLRTEDFKDDRKDAGDMGAGHSVTALYEVIPSGSGDVDADPLRYQPAAMPVTGAHGDELLFVKLRYKAPGSETSTEFSHAVADRVRPQSTDFAFASAVAEFGMLLRDSPYRGESSIEHVIATARRSLGPDREGYRAGFVDMVEAYRRIATVHAVR